MSVVNLIMTLILKKFYIYAHFTDLNIVCLSFRRPYDIFQVSEREFEENDAIFKEIMKLVRLLMYLIMFTAILGGAVANKLSLMLLISGLNKVCTYNEYDGYDDLN